MDLLKDSTDSMEGAKNIIFDDSNNVKKDIDEKIKEFSGDYSKKKQIIDEKVLGLEKKFPDFDKARLSTLGQIDRVAKQIQKFHHKEVESKMALLNIYISNLGDLLDNLLQNKIPYGDGPEDDKFLTLTDKVCNIFNYNDYDYVDLQTYPLNESDMLHYLKDKSNERVPIVVSKLENISITTFSDLCTFINSFDITFQSDNKYNYLFERIIEKNKNSITEWTHIGQMIRLIKNKNRREILSDVVHKDPRLGLFLLKELSLRYGANPDRESKMNAYNLLVKEMSDYLLFNTIDQKGKIEIIKIINMNIKENDKDIFLNLIK